MENQTNGCPELKNAITKDQFASILCALFPNLSHCDYNNDSGSEFILIPLLYIQPLYVFYVCYGVFGLLINFPVAIGLYILLRAKWIGKRKILVTNIAVTDCFSCIGLIVIGSVKLSMNRPSSAMQEAALFGIIHWDEADEKIFHFMETLESVILLVPAVSYIFDLLIEFISIREPLKYSWRLTNGTFKKIIGLQWFLVLLFCLISLLYPISKEHYPQSYTANLLFYLLPIVQMFCKACLVTVVVVVYIMIVCTVSSRPKVVARPKTKRGRLLGFHLTFYSLTVFLALIVEILQYQKVFSRGYKRRETYPDGFADTDPNKAYWETAKLVGNMADDWRQLLLPIKVSHLICMLRLFTDPFVNLCSIEPLRYLLTGRNYRDTRKESVMVNGTLNKEARTKYSRSEDHSEEVVTITHF